MRLERTWLTAALTAAAVAVAGVGAAVAGVASPTIDDRAEHEDGAPDEAEDSAEDHREGADTGIADAGARERAGAAAVSWLGSTHGVTGTATATEVGDEESYYEVEVTLEDGRHVDVQLTEDFAVVGLD